jgi:hypothetical protein
MTQESKAGIPMKFYVFGTLTVLALVAVSVIPSTMVYRLRLFDAVGLPEWMAEVLRSIIIIATPVAVLATGLVRVYAVSDSTHAEKLMHAAVLEIVAFVCEILAALVNGNDIFALVGQGLFLSVAIMAVSAALVITNSASGFYRLVVAHNEQSLSYAHEYNKLYKEQMQTPEIKAAMKAAITEQIKTKSEEQAGRPLWEQSRTGLVPLNGHSAEKTFASDVISPNDGKPRA